MHQFVFSLNTLIHISQSNQQTRNLEENPVAPLKFNMEPSNEGVVKLFSFSRLGDFQVPAVNFPGCTEDWFVEVGSLSYFFTTGLFKSPVVQDFFHQQYFQCYSSKVCSLHPTSRPHRHLAESLRYGHPSAGDLISRHMMIMVGPQLLYMEEIQYHLLYICIFI